MMHGRTLGWWLLIALLVSPGPAPAQPGAVKNPHGDFRGDCHVCHDAQGWTPARIRSEFRHEDHGMRLDGAHEGTPCLLCHASLEFSDAAGSQCVDCHDDVHLGELGLECDRCHTTRSFIDRSQTRRLHRESRFPLTGAHAAADCFQCHGPAGGGSMSFVNTSTQCEACHLADYEAAVNPDHSAFPLDCAGCHSTGSWSGGSFDHALTGFALTGAHRTIDCQRCHVGFQFTGTSADCYSCHRDDYDGTTDPGHAAAGFPTDCAACHGTDRWEGAVFDHALTAFPLTGAHVTVDCAQCHAGSVYSGTPTDCYACHRVDYEGTTDPVHIATGFGTDCAACHGTDRWEGAVFDHSTFFPITSGAHAGMDCAECHVNPTNYAAFECILCHEHSDEAQVNADHSEEPGYQYLSSACYECHPDGRH